MDSQYLKRLHFSIYDSELIRDIRSMMVPKKINRKLQTPLSSLKLFMHLETCVEEYAVVLIYEDRLVLCSVTYLGKILVLQMIDHAIDSHRRVLVDKVIV